MHRYEVHVHVNFSFGFILRILNDDGTMTNTYIHSSHNNGVMLGRAFRIASDNDIMAFKERFDTGGYLLIANHNKPSSKEVVECLANITFYVGKCEEIPKLLGRPPITLPDHIRSKRVIYTLIDGKKGPYTDNLCFFRVLCCYRGETIAGCRTWAKERAVKKLFKEAFPGANPRLFPGVVLSDIPRLEQWFQLDINIFELSWIDGKSRGEIILRSEGLFKTN